MQDCRKLLFTYFVLEILYFYAYNLLMNFNVSGNDILRGNIIRGILIMSVPLMLLNLINTAYALVDTFFVGKINELAVGAVSLVAPILSCGNALIAGLCAAAVALISRALGEGDKEKADKVCNQIFVIGVVLCTIAGFVFLACRDVILAWMETPEDIYTDTRNYLTYRHILRLFVFIHNIFLPIRKAVCRKH